MKYEHPIQDDLNDEFIFLPSFSLGGMLSKVKKQNEVNTKAVLDDACHGIS